MFNNIFCNIMLTILCNRGIIISKCNIIKGDGLTMGATANLEIDIVRMVERLIPVSEFSKGKTSHIFNDVKKNNSEYIILKNNQPTAVLISVDEYKKAKQITAFLERVDEKVLFEQALRAQASFNQAEAISLDELMAKHDLDPAVVSAAAESVEIE